MNDSVFSNLLTAAVTQPGHGYLDAFLSHVKNMPLAENVIAYSLNESLENRNWKAINFLVLAACSHPSPIYVPILCSILDEANPEMNNENVADILSDIPDESALPTLRRAINKTFPYDADNHHVNRKILWVLEKIGTTPAIELIQKAKDSPYEEVREEAEEILVRKKW